MTKNMWLALFTEALTKLRPQTGSRLRAAIALAEWASHGTTDPVEAAKRWVAARNVPPKGAT
jgi:hypothetical protein